MTSFLNATSSGIDPGGKTFMVLYWSPAPKVIGYNLYRSEKSTPLNGKKPIASVKTCDDLKALIPIGSPEWEMLGNAFSSLSIRRDLRIVADELGRARIAATGTLRPGLLLKTPDPCIALERGLTAEEEVIFDVLANVNLKLRLARGLGYIDHEIQADQWYTYELRGVREDGTEVVLAQSAAMQAGHYRPPDSPSGFTVTAADHQVLALWNRNNYAFSYIVRRLESQSRPYQIVNAQPIFFDRDTDLQGNKLDSPRPGFLDYQRWSDDGLPVDHEVNGISIHGPENYVTYYYQVASRDILNRTGDWSNYQSATPTNQTPPMAPTDFQVDSTVSPPGLVLAWRKVTRDVKNHQILQTVQTYKIYRADTLEKLEDLSSLDSYFVGSITANPTDPTDMMLTWIDTDPILVPPYGEKDFWYRILCVDADGNHSSPSVTLSGRVLDTTAPGPTRVTGAGGHADHITVYWSPNTEPDLAGYQVYRGISDRGRPYSSVKEKITCDFVLVGDISLREAEARIAKTGRIYFDDYSVPEGSPICYVYWIRAFDGAQNLYNGNYGCPASPSEYVCQRLYEETPPPVPIISGLKARNNSVLVEWIASPIQDLRAFHIYRSEEEDSPPVFVGCVLSDGTLWPGKWTGMKPSCADIPAEPDPQTVHASFVDEHVEPSRIFWYRVSALDWLGNESEGNTISRIPAVSTFTYSKDLPIIPDLLPSVGSTSDGCGLIISWNPPYDPSEVEGFLVFRSLSESGMYRQISPIVQGNSFSDKSALRGIDYWYRVQALDKRGKLSEPSQPVRHRY